MTKEPNKKIGSLTMVVSVDTISVKRLLANSCREINSNLFSEHIRSNSKVTRDTVGMDRARLPQLSQFSVHPTTVGPMVTWAPFAN